MRKDITIENFYRKDGERTNVSAYQDSLIVAG